MAHIHGQIVKRGYERPLPSLEPNQRCLRLLQFIIHNKPQCSTRQYHNQYQIRTNNHRLMPTSRAQASNRISTPASTHRAFSQSVPAKFTPSNHHHNNNSYKPKDTPITPEIIKQAQTQPIPQRLSPDLRHYIQTPDVNGQYTFPPPHSRPPPPLSSRSSSYSSNPIYQITKSITKFIARFIHVRKIDHRNPVVSQPIRAKVSLWLKVSFITWVVLWTYSTVWTWFEGKDISVDGNRDVEGRRRAWGPRRERGEMPDDEVTRRMVRGEVTRVEGVLPLDEFERRRRAEDVGQGIRDEVRAWK